MSVLAVFCMLGCSTGNHVRIGKNNSGAITLSSAATRAEEQSVASGHVQDSEPVGAETSQPRLKGCSFGSCTVIIEGNNSGAITVPLDFDCTVSIGGTNSGAITGASCVQQGFAVQATDASGFGYDGSRYASRLTYTSGPCNRNIQGDNSLAITLT
ncbi:hypothetical protein FOCC_FOCC006201 [Frankliniella occidentalis]|nr:hypothetical protein FOCC_FOCC006201 [Frankliniella occidentalis]